MELTARAHLDAVGLYCFLSSQETVQFRFCSWAGASRRELGAKHIGHFFCGLRVTHWARLTCRAADIGGSTQQFRVRVAHVLSRHFSGANSSSDPISQQSVFNRCLYGIGGDSETHERKPRGPPPRSDRAISVCTSPCLSPRAIQCVRIRTHCTFRYIDLIY